MDSFDSNPVTSRQREYEKGRLNLDPEHRMREYPRILGTRYMHVHMRTRCALDLAGSLAFDGTTRGVRSSGVGMWVTGSAGVEKKGESALEGKRLRSRCKCTKEVENGAEVIPLCGGMKPGRPISSFLSETAHSLTSQLRRACMNEYANLFSTEEAMVEN